MSILHFGIKVLDKPTNHINKASYLAAKPEHMPGWTEEHYPMQIQRAGLNYDMNMQFFETLDAAHFTSYIEKQVKKFKMKECIDLTTLDGVEGLYMLVLDAYKQVYIGISGDIKKRVLSHWRKWKSLERLIFGDICNSILSIDSFGPLDTTRIFYIESNSTYKLEEKVLKAFDPVYTLNRTAGGIGSYETYTDTQSSALLAVAAHRRGKNLVPFADVHRIKEIVPESDFKYYLSRYPELKEKL